MTNLSHRLTASDINHLDTVVISSLGLKPKFARRLHKWGMRTLGDIARADLVTIRRACHDKPNRLALIADMMQAHMPASGGDTDHTPRTRPWSPPRITPIPVDTVALDRPSPKCVPVGVSERAQAKRAIIDDPEVQTVTARILATGWTRGMVESHVQRWRAFCRWARINKRAVLPTTPEIVSDYLTSLSNCGRESLRLHVQSLVAVHELFDLTLDKNAAAIVTVQSSRPISAPKTAHEVRAITRADLEMMFPNEPDTLEDLRDRAILFLSYAAGLTTAEVASLSVESLSFHDDGMTLTTPVWRRGYTWFAHAYEFETSSDPLCPIQACRDWLEASELTQKCLFRRIKPNNLSETFRSEQISAMMRKRVRAAGLNSDELKGLSFRIAWKDRSKSLPPGSYRKFGELPQVKDRVRPRPPMGDQHAMH